MPDGVRRRSRRAALALSFQKADNRRVAVTGGDLVFAGELSGDFVVFDANDGKIPYKHNVGGPIAGGMVSYAAGGEQRVAAVSG